MWRSSGLHPLQLMKRLFRVACVLLMGVGLIGHADLAGAAVEKRKPVATQSAGTKKPSQNAAKAASGGRSAAPETRKASARGKATATGKVPARAQTRGTAGKAPAQVADKGVASQCRTVRVKTSHGMRSRKVCSKSAAPAEPLLAGPAVDGGALTRPPSETKEPEIKARTVPERAYAVDGETFFFQGRKFRVSGLKGGEVGSEMATQRLQKALDSGTLMVEPVDVDSQGVATATVRVNGRSLENVLAQP